MTVLGRFVLTFYVVQKGQKCRYESNVESIYDVTWLQLCHGAALRAAHDQKSRCEDTGEDTDEGTGEDRDEGRGGEQLEGKAECRDEGQS